MINQNIIGLAKRLGLAGYALLPLAAIVSHLAVLSNDSFPLLWQAEHFSLQDPQTFYNGLFPIGYPGLLWLATLTHAPLLTLEVVQVVLALFYARLAWKFSGEFLSGRLQSAATLLMLLYPWFVRSALSATPDFLAALTALCGFMVLVKKQYFVAGVWFGLCFILRMHGLAIAVAVIVALISLSGREQQGRLWLAVKIILGTLPFVIAQGLLQLWSGHGFFESDQWLNVYRMMYGIDWNNPPLLKQSVLSLIFASPGRFVSAYCQNMLLSLHVLVPIIIVLFLRVATTLKVLALSALLYILAITTGFSPRADVIVWPVAAIAIVTIIHKLIQSRIEAIVAICIILAFVVGSVLALYGAHRSAERVEEYRAIQNRLAIQDSASASRVYTDDFAFYFPSLPEALPRISGGWAEVALPEYLRSNPHIAAESAMQLHDALKSSDITYAIFREPPINAGFAESASSDSTQFQLIQRTATHVVYRVK